MQEPLNNLGAQTPGTAPCSSSAAALECIYRALTKPQIPTTEQTPSAPNSSLLSSKGKAPCPISSCTGYLFPLPKGDIYRYIHVCAPCVHTEIALPPLTVQTPARACGSLSPSPSVNVSVHPISTENAADSWGDSCQRGCFSSLSSTRKK